ncbi:MAG: excinuclease ABC subunit UvrC [Chloroflexi bacterium]|nr:excinuclease ABC subunit UvrC [Chloroflexota bacterium]
MQNLAVEPLALGERLKSLPEKPGVYIFRDGQGNVLYVGKAASLKHRVRSYFGAGLPPKLEKMLARVVDLEYIITDSEQEALILECNFIKRHKPRYNVRLRDDKNYPYLKITVQEDWPRVYITRRLEREGARYFGPYASAASVRTTLDLVKKLFPFCSCNKFFDGQYRRPCLEYYIRRCVAPCTGGVTKEEYRRIIEQLILFLEGRQEAVLRQLRASMKGAAESLEFERAAWLRDQIQSVEKVIQGQKVVSTRMEDEDVIAFAREGDEACGEVFFVRRGKVVGRDHFLLEGTQEEELPQIVASFLNQFYTSAPFIPPQILLPCLPQEPETEWLRSLRGSPVSLRVPQRGKKRRLLEMVAANAQEALQQFRLKRHADNQKALVALEELQVELSLPRLPQRIECYDISNIQGASAVGSMVVFEKGQPKPTHYRRFRIKTVLGANDYAMLQEVLRRRFRRGKNGAQGEATSVWEMMPDLLIVDGGRGQLNAVLEAMAEMEVDFIPVAGLAKEREELFVPGVDEPILLPRTSQALYLVQRVRDEAHRFALSYHLKVRQRRGMASVMDSIPGIGPKRKRALIQRFGSVKAVKEASLDELAAVVGMTRSLAQRVKEHL